MQVSIADLIRTSIKLYLEDLRKAYDGKDRNTNRDNTKK